jgi:alkylation response protein AidB-like acyl-CoA dehydrogenase
VTNLERVLAAVEAAGAGQIAERAAAVDRERAFPAANVELLRELGALALVVPTGAGGLGGGLSAIAAACEALGSACASTAMVFLMHTVTAATLAAGGGPGAERALRAIVEQGTLGSLAFSERGTGAHFYAPEMQAVRDNGGVRLSGRKSFVTSAGHAAVYLTLLQGEQDGTADAYLVPAVAGGLRFEGEWTGLGMTGNASIATIFDDVRLSSDARLGDPGRALDLVFSAVAPSFLVGLAAVNCGIARAAATVATAHAAGRRYRDGSSLAAVDAVQRLLADMDVAVRCAGLLVREAARLGDAGDASALVAIMESKVLAPDMAASVTQQALEVTGGQGYTHALPIERHLRDARAGAVMAPTNAVLRSWIGKALAGLPVP